MPLLVVALLLWLPGYLLHRGFAVARGPWGTGRLAVEASLSLAFLSLVLLPLYLARAPVALLPAAVTVAIAVLAAAALVVRLGRAATVQDAAGPLDGATRLEAVAFAVALALLVPVTLAHSGANVDDWWDLSFVNGWIADGHLGFAQMALSPDPDTNASPLHPRFLWNVWLLLQTVVVFVTGEQAWRIQASALAAVTVVLVVSAQAALARALFRRSPAHAPLVTATVAMTAAWIWGTEALPLFVRGYQDKLFAAFVLAPVLLALVVDAAAEDADAGGEADGRKRRTATLSVAAAAIATVSVHSLVFTMSVFVCVLALFALHGRRLGAWLRTHAGIAAALVVPSFYPIAQAVALAITFGDQGVSLAMPDNPVVRAHLSLNRLVGAAGPAWIVHPGAVFGPVAFAALVAVGIGWCRRREDAGARVLIATAVVPCTVLFVPGLAALGGGVWVPWMLYRLGWMVPVAPMLGYAVVSLGTRARLARKRPVAAVALTVVVALLAASTATDRARRGMDEHPGQPPGAPVAAAAVVYDFLAKQAGRAAVLAPPNFSELVPAMSGKPVVAFPERGTLVFSTDETRGYERLRDRATFYASSTTASERDEVAIRYGVRWAVLPRRLVASGSESAWLWRFGPEALLAARAVDDAGREPCTAGSCSNWWSATRGSLAAGLSGAWVIVLDTRDYFVVERLVAQPSARRDWSGAPRAAPSPGAGDAAAGSPRWLHPFALTSEPSAPRRGEVLATVTGTPGAHVTFAPPPRFVVPSVSPIWSEGPGAWEDAPADAVVTLDVGVACRISAVEVVPHLPHERRDVFELQVEDRHVRAAARHNVAIVVPVDDTQPRTAVTLHVRSLIGNPVSLADVRLLGERASCVGPWPLHRKPRAPELAAPVGALLGLAAAVPSSGRPFVSLARQVSRSRGASASVGLLVEATRREPSLVEARIDLGFTEDELAAAATAAGPAALARAAALEAFQAGVVADSHSAWAHGCAAWAYRRAGHAPLAIWHALRAAQLDPLYADAWTILAYALADLHLPALAERALNVAGAADPARNWPALARADLAVGRGDVEAARAALREWILGHPFDEAARAKLSEIATASASGAQARPEGAKAGK